MMRDFRGSRDSFFSDYTPPRLTAAHALFLTKLSKHLVLLSCLMIVGRATGHSLVSPVGIFPLILFAVALDCAGRSLPRRPVYRPPSPRRSL